MLLLDFSLVLSSQVFKLPSLPQTQVVLGTILRKKSKRLDHNSRLKKPRETLRPTGLNMELPVKSKETELPSLRLLQLLVILLEIH